MRDLIKNSGKKIQESFSDFLFKLLKIQSININLKINTISNISSFDFLLKNCNLQFFKKVDFSQNQLELRALKYAGIQLFLRCILKRKVTSIPFNKKHIKKKFAIIDESILYQGTNI